MERTWRYSGGTWRSDDGTGGGAPAARWVTVDDPADLTATVRRNGASQEVVEALEADDPGRRVVHVLRLPGGGVHLVAPTLAWVDDTRDVHTGRLEVVATPTLVVSVETGAAGVSSGCVATLHGPDAPRGDDSPGQHLLGALLHALVARAADVEGALGEAVADTESEVFSAHPTGDPVQRIYALKREIAEARRALMPLASGLPDVVADDDDGPGPDAMPWVQRLEHAVDRLDSHLDAHDRLLADMLSAHLSRVSVQQNEDMRRISAWAAIAAVPTLLASVYGMNFQHMPELSWTFGYPLVLAVMGTVCVVLHRLFRRSGWL